MGLQRIEFGQADAAPSCGTACGCAHGEESAPAAAGTGEVVTELRVDGMTCGHCVKAVTSELRALPGVDAVEVELVEGGASQVRVQSTAALDPAAVAAAIDEAGYTLA